jgi:hypothetical protein
VRWLAFIFKEKYTWRFEQFCYKNISYLLDSDLGGKIECGSQQTQTRDTGRQFARVLFSPYQGLPTERTSCCLVSSSTMTRGSRQVLDVPVPFRTHVVQYRGIPVCCWLPFSIFTLNSACFTVFNWAYANFSEKKMFGCHIPTEKNCTLARRRQKLRVFESV